MRILYLTDRLSPKGGAGWHLLQVIRWAVTAGHEVRLAAAWADREFLLPVVPERVRGLGARVARREGLAGLDRLLAWAELVHVQNVMNPVVLNRAVGELPTVVTVQDHRVFCPGPGRTLPDGARCREPMGEACAACLPDPHYREEMLGLTRARLDAVRRAWRVIVLSRYMAGELEGVGIRRVEVLPPWVAPGPLRKVPGDTIVLGGRLVAHKDPVTAARAWERAGRPLPLRVAGDGPLAAELGTVRCLGWLSSERLVEELRSARMLLFPARWQEPFGILGVEALAQGTPVVVADVGGTREWSGRGCLRVAPGDVDAMSEAIVELARDPLRACRLGEEGRELVVERFSKARIESRLAGLYT